MKEENELDFIATAFSRWHGKVCARKGQGLGDINLVSEDLVIQLLNTIFNLNLINLNLHERSGIDSIDLGDKENKIAFQVTTASSSKKIKNQLKLFVDNKHSETYTNGIRFIILFRNKPQKGKHNFKEELTTFHEDQHILTDQDLVREIRKMYIENKERFFHIRQILEAEFFDAKEKPEKTNDFPMAVFHEPLSVDAKMNILKERNEYEEAFNAYFLDRRRVYKDYKSEIEKIIPSLEKILDSFSETKTHFYRLSRHQRFISIIDPKTLFSLHLEWQDLHALAFSNTLNKTSLFLTGGIYKADNFDHKKFDNKPILNPVQSAQYEYHMNRSRKLGWMMVKGREDNFYSTEDLVKTLHNQLLNYLVF